MTIYDLPISVFIRRDSCILINDERPEDRNDPDAAKTAIELDLPTGFSDKAKAIWEYLNGAAALYEYQKHLVVTDESLELTAYHKDGAIGGPRWICDSWEELEGMLGKAYDELTETDLI